MTKPFESSNNTDQPQHIRHKETYQPSGHSARQSSLRLHPDAFQKFEQRVRADTHALRQQHPAQVDASQQATTEASTTHSSTTFDHHTQPNISSQREAQDTPYTRQSRYNPAHDTVPDTAGPAISEPHPEMTQGTGDKRRQNPRLHGKELAKDAELPQQFSKYQRQNVSGRGLNCMIRAVLVSANHNQNDLNFEPQVDYIRQNLVEAGIVESNQMLNLGDDTGLTAIAMMRSIMLKDNQPLLDPQRGIDVYTLDPKSGELRVTHAVEGEAGQPSYSVFLENSTPGNEHYYALIPEPHQDENPTESFDSPDHPQETSYHQQTVSAPEGTNSSEKRSDKGEERPNTNSGSEELGLHSASTEHSRPGSLTSSRKRSPLLLSRVGKLLCQRVKSFWREIFLILEATQYQIYLLNRDHLYLQEEEPALSLI